MKSRFPFLSVLLAGGLVLSGALALRAQEPAPENNDIAPAPAAPDAPLPAPEPSASAPELEKPAAPATPEAPSVAVPEATVPPTAQPEQDWVRRGEVVVFNNNILVRENERASKAVAICGNIEIRGCVDQDVVAILGDVRVDGSVGKVVAILGKVTLGPKAQVNGEVVSIGGGVDNPSDAPIRGNLVNLVPFLPRVGPLLSWLGDSVTHVRLLSPGLAWPWYVFGTGVVFCLLLAAAFGRGVNACAQALEERPGATLTTALALLPLFTLLLISTGIGILLLPFLAVAVVFAFAFGKTAVLAFLGRTLLKPCGAAAAAERAWLTVLLGAVVLALLYCVPWLGLLVWALTTWVGLGMVVATILEKRRREKAAIAAARPVSPAPSPVVAPAAAVPERAAFVAAPFVAVDPVGGEAGVGEAAAVGSSGNASEAVPVPPVMAPPMRAPEAIVAATLPRADFWVRLWALLVDIVLVAVGGGVSMLFAVLPFPLLFGGYMFGFWLWKGTTIGGIIFNLKVVRLDGRPVDGATAAVRTLMAFLSAVTLLGFLWCLWDDAQQTWHDKVAGTVVVRVPKSTPLV